MGQVREEQKKKRKKKRGKDNDSVKKYDSNCPFSKLIYCVTSDDEFVFFFSFHNEVDYGHGSGQTSVYVLL